MDFILCKATDPSQSMEMCEICTRKLDCDVYFDNLPNVTTTHLATTNDVSEDD